MEERKSVKEFLSLLKDASNVKIRGDERDAFCNLVKFGPLTVKQFLESGRDPEKYIVAKTIITDMSKKHCTLMIDCFDSTGWVEWN